MSGVMVIPSQQSTKRKMININENTFEMSKIQDSINNIMTTLMEMQDKYSALEAKVVESNHKIETASLKDKVEQLTNTVEGKIAKKKPGPKKDKPTVYNLYMKYKSNEMKESGELTDANYKQKWGECSKSWSKERDDYLESYNQEYKDIDSVDKNKRTRWRTKNRDALEKFHDEIINKYNLQ
tara:strand:- start:946 stop:1491 length:546 start_codon:yes stop_codon:yes gene_type:complete